MIPQTAGVRQRDRGTNHVNASQHTAAHLLRRGQQVPVAILPLLVVQVAEASGGHHALALHLIVVGGPYHLKMKKKQDTLFVVAAAFSGGCVVVGIDVAVAGCGAGLKK